MLKDTINVYTSYVEGYNTLHTLYVEAYNVRHTSNVEGYIHYTDTFRDKS